MIRRRRCSGGCDHWRWLRLCRSRRPSSDIVIIFTRRRGGSCPAGRTGTGQRRTRCKSIRAPRPAPRPRRRRALSVALLFGTGRHTDQLNACIHYVIISSASPERSPSTDKKHTLQLRKYLYNNSYLVRKSAVLGVTINNRFFVTEHVSKVLSSCSGLLYALRILRTHGMNATSLYDVFQATIVAKLLYCSPAWSGFCSAADISRLDAYAFLKRCKRYGYCPDNFLKISELFSDADDQLFSRVLCTPAHVLKPLLPNHIQHDYNLRDRSHNFELINKNVHLNDRHFIVRQLYKDSYWLFRCVLTTLIYSLHTVLYIVNYILIVKLRSDNFY